MWALFFAARHLDMSRTRAIGEVPKSKFARWNREPNVGERVPIPQPDGSPVDVVVTDVSESNVTVDFNHLLAGEKLTIDIELVDIDSVAH
jgi:FKBP-type peptidyl-prolyl cis-trans isomerase 2